MAIDRIDWHWDDAEAYYRINHGGGSGKELTQEQIRTIALHAGNHIGLFLRWLVDRDLQSPEALPEKVEKLRAGGMTGAEFLMEECDGRLWEEDISPQAMPFVREYYDGGKYFEDYGDCCLGDDKPLYGTLTSEEDYRQLSARIDRAYEEFKKRNGDNG